MCVCKSVCALFVRVSGWPVPACCSTCILVNLTLLNYAQHSRMEGGAEAEAKAQADAGALAGAGAGAGAWLVCVPVRLFAICKFNF